MSAAAMTSPRFDLHLAAQAVRGRRTGKQLSEAPPTPVFAEAVMDEDAGSGWR